MKSVGSRSRGSVHAVIQFTLLHHWLGSSDMESAKRSCLAISLILLLLLVPTIRGARHVASVKSTGADGGGYGNGYTSHRSHNPSNPNDGGSGTPVVDPHNVATRGHHHRGLATRTAAGGDPRHAACMLLGAIFFLLVLC